MIKDVYNITTLCASLRFVSQLNRRVLYVTFGDNKVIIRTSPIGNIVAVKQQFGKSYELLDMIDNSDVYTSDAIYSSQSNSTTLWYCRLAYLHQGSFVTPEHSETIGILATINHDMHDR